MLVEFSPVFVADIKIICGYNSVTPLNLAAAEKQVVDLYFGLR